jgi:hypothetical protein
MTAPPRTITVRTASVRTINVPTAAAEVQGASW